MHLDSDTQLLTDQDENTFFCEPQIEQSTQKCILFPRENRRPSWQSEQSLPHVAIIFSTAQEGWSVLPPESVKAAPQLSLSCMSSSSLLFQKLGM